MSNAPLVPWQAATQALCAQQTFPTHCLYMVATPIGNRADITLRALHALQLADVVACEDSRNSANLLHSLGLHKPLWAVHEHNERSQIDSLLQRLSEGQRVAYISDAGTPGISDPGAFWVDAARRAGFRVMPLPGPSALACALSATGTPQHGGLSDGTLFAGFLPAKGQARQDHLTQVFEQAQRLNLALVLYEAPHRIVDLAQRLAELPPCQVTVCRELSKQFEDIHTLAQDELAAHFAQKDHIRGEFVIVVQPHITPKATQDAEASALNAQQQHILHTLMADLPLRQAVDLTVTITGLPRKPVYNHALQQQALKP